MRLAAEVEAKIREGEHTTAAAAVCSGGRVEVQEKRRYHQDLAFTSVWCVTTFLRPRARASWSRVIARKHANGLFPGTFVGADSLKTGPRARPSCTPRFAGSHKRARGFWGSQVKYKTMGLIFLLCRGLFWVVALAS